ncbi:hypothetical protein AHAS_Ahas13G0391900 [Arachis hypogaea]|uniref:F-box domain-containing protein n=1 Tax=Arachis hypogaea TaxID=3818 RepID=A0A444ZXE4_ARAHY|nr:hypothetical protein Ahy_B03g063494 [Arachis hypogaea]
MSLLVEAAGARKKSKALETPEQEKQEGLIPSLPNDVALDCLACMPRSYHPNLSQVSKTIRSLLSSSLFYDTHTTLYGKQTMLYFFVNYLDSNHVQWFMVNLDDPDPVLRLPLIPSHVRSVRPPCPSMRISRDKGRATALHGKVYVVGEPSQKSSIFGEILDPVVGSWEEIKNIPSSDDGSLTSWVYNQMKEA